MQLGAAWQSPTKKLMEKSTQETSEVEVHRTILQGMAVHLQKLQGEVFDLQQAFEGLMQFLQEQTADVTEESANEGGSPAVPETGRGE